ncbi:MAG: hypothetical protein V7676_16310 [Parasphingorhabdus sp.]|uniref:hypothetical protein n=1 Tax=Parasphingorhabdus sp. TaxID=2709688 RepID=UPI003001A89C|tara:strand:- start:5892 stop:7289 length:1398 start_codon:yes stop_codon:yes gene_type:complete
MYPIAHHVVVPLRTGRLSGLKSHSRGSSKTAFICSLPFLLAGLVVNSAPAAAQVNVYDSEELSVDVALDASSVLFVQSNSWFGEPEANIGVDSKNWAEFAIEPQIYFKVKDIFGGELSAAASVVSTKTYGESADGFAAGLNDPGKTTLEKLYVGWKAELGADDFIEVIGGDFDYQIGTGFLVKDGGRDGGDRGGFYLGARSASRNSALVRVKYDNLQVEGFYLGNNPGRGGIKAHVGGVNAEYSIPDRFSIGATYIQVAHFDDPLLANTAENLKTYDVRGSVNVNDQLKLSGEYAIQRGAAFYRGQGWYLQTDYTVDSLPFTPTITYRYAVVSGDDPGTPQNEEFIPLAYGFTDYGQWYQGEIAGNWIFGNSNQKTHMIKGSAALSDKVSLTGSWLNFTLDEPEKLGVTDSAFGNEFDLWLDWQASERLFLSAAGAVLVPQDGAKQFTGGSKTWAHFMLYASVSF